VEDPPPYLSATAAPEPPLTIEALIAQAHAQRQGIPYESREQLLARLPERLRALADLILGGQMQSCEEAKFYLTTCGVKRLDGDGDGVPCTQLCKP
jgi:hypothetical protein